MDASQLRAAVTHAIADLEVMKQRFGHLLAQLDGAAVQVRRQGLWTRPMLEQLWSAVRHLDGIRALFELTAATPGQPITFSRVIARSGLAERRQRNEHARMSRVSAELFGATRWPIEAWQGPPHGPEGKAEMLYLMDETVAIWWRAIQREGGNGTGEGR